MIFKVLTTESLPLDTTCDSCHCGHSCHLSDLKPIGFCSLTPGDPAPAGRCPECNDLMFPQTRSRTTLEHADWLGTAAAEAHNELLRLGVEPGDQLMMTLRLAIMGAAPSAKELLKTE
jgi:hypothetical protein